VKELLGKSIILILDILAIMLSILVGYYLRILLGDVILRTFNHPFMHYLTYAPLYLFPLLLMAYEGIYTKRYDFWHESREVFRSLFLALISILAILAITKTIDTYSRAAIIMIFLSMTFFIPLFKNIGKKTLFKIGLWQREAQVISNDSFISEELFKNPYFGYIESDNQHAKTVFIDSNGFNPQGLQKLVEIEIQKRHEVIFVPLMNSYNLTQSQIYELSNTHTNLIVYTNRLKSPYRRVVQQLFNYLLVVLFLPIFLLLIGIFAILIKLESVGPIFFIHNRIGRNGTIIPIYKFRSMYHDAQERLEKLLKEDQALTEEWESSFKLKDDPRITKVGKFLRKTSFDELPQIFNILRGEMNFVGPRPVIQDEIDNYYKKEAEYYYMVKPGITGLWQVSGRSDMDYTFRVNTDKWYVTNWSLWLDIVILFKTVKVVLKQGGAY
jgi:undecaprenyl-phosphate galactose phosphotransferase